MSLGLFWLLCASVFPLVFGLCRCCGLPVSPSGCRFRSLGCPPGGSVCGGSAGLWAPLGLRARAACLGSPCVSARLPGFGCRFASCRSFRGCRWWRLGSLLGPAGASAPFFWPARSLKGTLRQATAGFRPPSPPSHLFRFALAARLGLRLKTGLPLGARTAFPLRSRQSGALAVAPLRSASSAAL